MIAARRMGVPSACWAGRVRRTAVLNTCSSFHTAAAGGQAYPSGASATLSPAFRCAATTAGSGGACSPGPLRHTPSLLLSSIFASDAASAGSKTAVVLAQEEGEKPQRSEVSRPASRCGAPSCCTARGRSSSSAARSSNTICRQAGARATSTWYAGTECARRYSRNGAGGAGARTPMARSGVGVSQMARRLSGMKGLASVDSFRAAPPGGITAAPNKQPKSAEVEVMARRVDQQTSTSRKSHARYSPTSSVSKATWTSIRAPDGSSAPPLLSGGTGSASRNSPSVPRMRTARSRTELSADPLITRTDSFSDAPLSTTPKFRTYSESRTPRTDLLSVDCTSKSPGVKPAARDWRVPETAPIWLASSSPNVAPTIR
eukprot:scaffold35023_cov30-Tisochrysis_lutea.AAC.4